MESPAWAGLADSSKPTASVIRLARKLGRRARIAAGEDEAVLHTINGEIAQVGPPHYYSDAGNSLS